jgi:TRAP-type transport system periplasmic protein
VAMPMNEVYDALSRGLVDGLLSGRESLESFRTGEHIQYITQNKRTAYTACMLVCMNKKKWDSLPADIRGIIDQLSAEQPEKFGKAWDDADSAAIGFLEKRGVKFLNLDQAEEQRWVERGAQPLFDDYVKKMKEKGLPGEEALGCVTGYLKAYKQ